MPASITSSHIEHSSNRYPHTTSCLLEDCSPSSSAKLYNFTDIHTKGNNHPSISSLLFSLHHISPPLKSHSHFIFHLLFFTSEHSLNCLSLSLCDFSIVAHVSSEQIAIPTIHLSVSHVPLKFNSLTHSVCFPFRISI